MRAQRIHAEPLVDHHARDAQHRGAAILALDIKLERTSANRVSTKSIQVGAKP